MPDFTVSQDGERRCTLVLRVRLTQQEWRELSEEARERGEHPKDLAEAVAELAIEEFIHNPYSR